MKKLLTALVLLCSFQAANAQLEYYQFMLNTYNNGERITDSRTFNIDFYIYDRTNPDALVYSHHFTPADTAENFGYDYNFFRAGDLFFKRTGELIITQGTDTMKIIFDNPKASAWTSIGMDKVEFRKGVFKFDEDNWPKNRRTRTLDNISFLVVEAGFDWEKIRR